MDKHNLSERFRSRDDIFYYGNIRYDPIENPKKHGDLLKNILNLEGKKELLILNGVKG